MMVTPDVAAKLESLSSDDFQMVIRLIDRLADKPSTVLRAAHEKYVIKNPMTMVEIDQEIQAYRREVKSL